MTPCLFCKIAAGEIPAKILFEDDRVLAFADIAPQAPLHLLVIPRTHITSLDHADPGDVDLMGHLLLTGAELARREGLSEDGYRAVINTGADGGQSVFHLHLHIIGGRPMRWPPG